MNQLQDLPHNPAESYTLGWNAEAFDCFDRFHVIVEVYRENGAEVCQDTAAFAACRLAKHMREYDLACDRFKAQQEELCRGY